jgi:hypothetical protein
LYLSLKKQTYFVFRPSSFVLQLKKEAESGGTKTQQQERREKMRSKHMTLKQKMAAKAGTEEEAGGRGRAGGRGGGDRGGDRGGSSSKPKDGGDRSDSSRRGSVRSGGASSRKSSRSGASKSGQG